jgi:hypothetical protein
MPEILFALKKRKKEKKRTALFPTLEKRKNN